jgi:hypothetical protein
MKPWQFLPIGIVALFAILFLPYYESYIAGFAAILIVVVVVVGFCLQPRRDFFRVHTRAPRRTAGGGRVREHDLLAIKLEVARLWLLFIPTSIGVLFLAATAANNSTWSFGLFKLLDLQFRFSTYLLLRVAGVVIFGITALLSQWITERWTLRDVVATYAMSASTKTGQLDYVFLDEQGSYYGGSTFLFGTSNPSIGRIVFYNEEIPERNKIAGGLLFHRVIVLGHGLTDLDHETTHTHLERARPQAAGI